MLFGLIADKRYITPINLNTLSVAIATGPFFLYEGLLQHNLYTQSIFAFLFGVGTGSSIIIFILNKFKLVKKYFLINC
jgi:hypothetical protein